MSLIEADVHLLGCEVLQLSFKCFIDIEFNAWGSEQIFHYILLAQFFQLNLRLSFNTNKL